KLIAATAIDNVEVSLIFNPSSGPGNSIDSNYVNSLGQGPLIDFKNGGGKVYGYIPTTFSLRNISDVKSDINKYYDTLYPGIVDGIFFDETSNNLANVGYYNEIKDTVKSYDSSALVISNPGTSFTNNPSGQTQYTVTDYANSADVIVTFENSADEYINNYTAPSWQSDFDNSHFAHIIFNQEVWDPSIFELALARQAGYIYITNDNLPNPYDSLADYWDQQFNAVNAMSAVPLPASILLFTPSVLLLGWFRRTGRRALRTS
ncbi:MAG: spherulation-specific family 4 protein, partial [Methylophagaceae bacterium]